MKRKKSATIKKDPAVLDEQKLREAIGKRIQNKRKAGNFSAETIAGHLRISRSALTLIETGRNNISGVILWKLASLLGSSIEEFFPKKSSAACLTTVEIEKLKEEDEDVENWAKSFHLI